MTNVETDSIDPAVLAELGREFFKVDKWLDRTGSPAPPPDPNSPLAADDAALDPYQLSHAAWAALSTAVDHMRALRSLIADAHVVHLYAPFTLLRAALETPRLLSGCWRTLTQTSECCAGCDSAGPTHVTR